MPRGSSSLAPWLSGHGLGGIFRPHTAPPAKRQHSLVDNSPLDTASNGHDEESPRHKRLRTSTPQPHSNPEVHSPRNETPSSCTTPMEEAEASAQEDTRRAVLLINELTNLVNIRLGPMSISGPAKNDLAKAALNLSGLLKQRFGAPGSVNLAEKDSDDDYYEYEPLDMAYYADADDNVSNTSSPTVDGSTTDPRIYTGDLAEPGWTESEYSGPETPESGFEEDLEDRFRAPEETHQVHEVVVIEDSDGEPENPYEELAEEEEENHHKEQATTAQVEKEVIEIPDDDEDDDSVIFTGENVIRYMRYFHDRPVRHSPERYISDGGHALLNCGGGLGGD